MTTQIIKISTVYSTACLGYWHFVMAPTPTPPPTPNQSAYHARTQVWKIEKHPLSRILDEKNNPFFNRNRWFGGPIKHPFLSKTRFFRNKAKVTFFVKVRIYVTASNWRHFLCTSYFSLRLNYGKSSNTLMHNNSNMRKKQMVINAYKILPFFEILQTHVCKMIPFYWFREFAPPIEKNTPFFAKMGTSVVYVLVGSGGPGWWELTGDRWIPLTKGQYCGKRFHDMT